MLQDGDKGVIIQRDKKSYAVAPHIPCGVVQPETLRKLADVAEKYGAQALKITSAARIAMVGVDEKDVDKIWSDLVMQWDCVSEVSRPVQVRHSASAAYRIVWVLVLNLMANITAWSCLLNSKSV
jgi:NAD(P)H-nitrite reductase large subunit